jgi:hypothetical protein
MPKEDTNIIHKVKECPVCHSQETVSRKGTSVAMPAFPEDAFTQLERTVTPVSNPAFEGAPVKAIVVHYDICVGCGLKYSTQSEIVTLPGKPMNLRLPVPMSKRSN